MPLTSVCLLSKEGAVANGFHRPFPRRHGEGSRTFCLSSNSKFFLSSSTAATFFVPNIIFAMDLHRHPWDCRANCYHTCNQCRFFRKLAMTLVALNFLLRNIPMDQHLDLDIYNPAPLIGLEYSKFLATAVIMNLQKAVTNAAFLQHATSDVGWLAEVPTVLLHTYRSVRKREAFVDVPLYSDGELIRPSFRQVHDIPGDIDRILGTSFIPAFRAANAKVDADILEETTQHNSALI